MNYSKSLLTLRAQHFFNQSARELFKIYYLLECSSKSFDSPKFLVQVLGFFQNELRMIISFDVKNRRQFVRAARTADDYRGSDIIGTVDSVYGSGVPHCFLQALSMVLALLCLATWWLDFPIAPKEANKKLSYYIFFRPMKSFNYCNSFNLCFNIVFFDFRNIFFWAVTSLQKEDVFFSVSWWGQRVLMEDHLVKWSLKCSTGRICSEFILCISWTN